MNATDSPMHDERFEIPLSVEAREVFHAAMMGSNKIGEIARDDQCFETWKVLVWKNPYHQYLRVSDTLQS